MRIEHVALQVAAPAEMVRWYRENLGMKIVRQKGDDSFFIADEAGRVVLEIYHNPAAKVPDYASMDPLELHVAFASDDVRADIERLTSAGASLEGAPADIRPTAQGDTFAIVRDPWGLAVQLVRRADPLTP